MRSGCKDLCVQLAGKLLPEHVWPWLNMECDFLICLLCDYGS